MSEEWAELSPPAQAARAVFLSHPGGNRLGNAEGWEASAKAAIEAAGPGLAADLTAAQAELAALRVRAGELRASLDTLTGRAEAGEVITEDEAAGYRKAIGPGATLGEQLDGLREQFENLAAGLGLAAQSTAPSKKSEIEAGCARAIRGILEHAK